MKFYKSNFLEAFPSSFVSISNLKLANINRLTNVHSIFVKIITFSITLFSMFLRLIMLNMYFLYMVILS